MKKKPLLILTFLVLLTALGGSTYRSAPAPDFQLVVEQEPVVSDSLAHGFVRVFDLRIDSNTLYQNIDFQFPYTSFIFEVAPNTNFVNAYYKTNQREIFKLDSLPPTDQSDDKRMSPFIIPDSAQQSFTFYSGKISGKIRLYLFHAPPIELQYKKRVKKVEDWCIKPELVRGKVWRNGLPEPVGTRESHDVGHCIVHHAASSNTNHDYINVVRNIYLLHTQTNGWDDIGYNFVVAQDGTIFEGREHQDIDSTDNIKGAHFCGKNGGTMGICMLGNYQEVAPTNQSLTSLKHILTWKCFKDEITPLGKSAHPNSTSELLNHIAGHRNGCATACPGDSLYLQLDNIRNTVDSLVKLCKPALTEEYKDIIEKITWYQRRTNNDLVVGFPLNNDITTIALTDLQGRQLSVKPIEKNTSTIVFDNLVSGTYVLRISLGDRVTHAMKVVITN